MEAQHASSIRTLILDMWQSKKLKRPSSDIDTTLDVLREVADILKKGQRSPKRRSKAEKDGKVDKPTETAVSQTASP